MLELPNLLELGLTEIEAAVFLLLLVEGPATIQILSKKLSAEEQKLEKVLHKMISKKHITHSKKGSSTILYANHNLIGIHF